MDGYLELSLDTTESFIFMFMLMSLREADIDSRIIEGFSFSSFSGDLLRSDGSSIAVLLLLLLSLWGVVLLLAEWLLLVGDFTGELCFFSLGHRGDENPKNVGSEAGLGDFLSFIRLALLLRIRTNLKNKKIKTSTSKTEKI